MRLQSKSNGYSYKLWNPSTVDVHAPYAFGDFLIAETKGRSQPLPPAYASHALSVANGARSHSNCRELWHSIAARCQGSKTSCKLLCAANAQAEKMRPKGPEWMPSLVHSLSRSWPHRVSCKLCKAAMLCRRCASSGIEIPAQALSNPSVAWRLASSICRKQSSPCQHLHMLFPCLRVLLSTFFFFLLKTFFKI